MRTEQFVPTSENEKVMWDYMLSHERFRYADVIEATGLSAYFLENFASKLRHHELIHRIGTAEGGAFYTVLDDVARKIFEASKKETPEGAIWTAIRSMKQFTASELGLVIGEDRPDIDIRKIKGYCALLRDTGYLVATSNKRKRFEPLRFQLVNDTGPLPPTRRYVKAVFDWNESTLVPSLEVQS